MAPYFSLFFLNVLFLYNFLILSSISSAIGCYTSIFCFGDSLSDTGNRLHISQPKRYNCGFSPYGETYFRHPTGRCSNGRLVIDFIAEHLGLPFVPPYYGGSLKSFREIGVNFAVGGATALDFDFLRETGIINIHNYSSLNVQLGLFKQLLPSLCSTTSDCKKLLSNSLIILGEIGGNDYSHAISGGVSIAVVREILPYIVNTIGLAVKDLIELGAMTILVPGALPIGCSPSLLTVFQGSDEKEYDNFTGCLNWLNKFAEHYNKQLVMELNRIRELHPHAKIIYVDYYNAAMLFYRSPDQFGFTRETTIKACCGGGGLYNYDPLVQCGNRLATNCHDPSLYASWDGVHYTEAMYKLIFTSIIEGPYCFPRFNASCINRSHCSSCPKFYVHLGLS